MKTRFGKDADGPFVEVTFTLRDQDDSPEFNFYSLSPDDRTKLCEHLPRKVNGLRARRDHSEAEPAGYRVAALLAELKRMREEGDGGMREAIDAVREHLTAPSPLDLAAAEVCAVDAAEVADTFDAWAALGDICRAEADGLAEERAQFAKAGRVALAGMLACDAADRGKGPPRDPYGHLDPCAACGERPAMICDLCSICEEQQHQTGGKWDGETLARMKAERAAKGGSK